MPLSLNLALPVVEQFIDLLRPHCEWVEVAGSVRRQRPLIKDVEIVAIPLPSLLAFLDGLVSNHQIEKALYGEKQQTRWGKKYRGMVYQGVKFELFLCDETNRGYIFWLRTGPDNHTEGRCNTYIMQQLKKAPFNVQDGYAWYKGQKLQLPDERDWFTLLGIPFISPQDRRLAVYLPFFNRQHTWGDPEQFVLQQQTLWSLDSMLKMEEKHLDSGVRKQPPLPEPFEWQYPWLDVSDYVWCYTGYGEFELLSQDDPVARLRLRVLQSERLRESERLRLVHYLDVRGQHCRQESELVAILSEALAIIRSENMMVEV